MGSVPYAFLAHVKTVNNLPAHTAQGSHFSTADPSARHPLSAPGIMNTRKSANGGAADAAGAAAAAAAAAAVGVFCECC